MVCRLFGNRPLPHPVPTDCQFEYKTYEQTQFTNSQFSYSPPMQTTNYTRHECKRQIPVFVTRNTLFPHSQQDIYDFPFRHQRMKFPFSPPEQTLNSPPLVPPLTTRANIQVSPTLHQSKYSSSPTLHQSKHSSSPTRHQSKHSSSSTRHQSKHSSSSTLHQSKHSSSATLHQSKQVHPVTTSANKFTQSPPEQTVKIS